MSWSVIYILGVMQALFLAVLLIHTRSQRWPGNVYLACLLFIIAGLLGLFVARFELENSIYPWVFWPVVATPSLIGPCLLFYLLSLRSQFTLMRRGNIWHLLPYALLLILFLPETLSPASLGLAHLDNSSTRVKISIASYFKSACVIGYLLACLQVLKGGEIASRVKGDATRFLRLLLHLFLAVSIVGSLLSTLFWLGIYLHPAADYLELSFLTLVTYLLAYYVFYFDVRPENPREKYVKSALSKDARGAVAGEVRARAVAEKLFTHPNYSARFLATELGISEQQLSEVLALEFNSNFNTLSNRWRFECFSELLEADVSGTLLELAFEAGFKSKSAFNRAVKDFSGLSPSQYRQKLKGSNTAV